MRLSRFFITRPIFAAVIAILITVMGAISYFALPVSQYPDIVPPTVTVNATYPGADAETVASTVAAPIEQEINGVDNMIYMSSQSTGDGNLTITVTFKQGTDLNAAQVLVQNRVAIAAPRLPQDVQRLGIVTRKTSPDFLMVVNLISPNHSLDRGYISNYALTQVRDRIARLDGVGDARQFANVIIRTDADGRQVRVSDVARVELGAADYAANTYLSGEPTVILGVFQRPGSNALAAAAAVKAEMENMSKSFPPGLEYRIIYNPTEFISQSIDAVRDTLLEAIALVVLVVILFLQRWRAAIIPLVAIPVSLIGTFAAMKGFGFSINNLSLFGIVLAIGIVVDDAIVVVEAIEHHIEDGLSPRD